MDKYLELNATGRSLEKRGNAWVKVGKNDVAQATSGECKDSVNSKLRLTKRKKLLIFSINVSPRETFLPSSPFSPASWPGFLCFLTDLPMHIFLDDLDTEQHIARPHGRFPGVFLNKSEKSQGFE